MQIHIGCSGFPVGRKRYYKEFNHVDVQITFYQILSDERLLKWREEAPEDFVFNIKAFQGITHPARSSTWRRANIEKKQNFGYFRNTSEVFWSWRETIREAGILGSKYILIQLPKSFRQTGENLKNIYNFFENIDRKQFKIAIELRGWEEDWIGKLCRDFDLIDVVDLNRREPVWLGSSQTLYVRFHGKYDQNGRIYAHYNYDPFELEEMAKRVKSFQDRAREAWINFNNTAMFKNALMFKEIIETI